MLCMSLHSAINQRKQANGCPRKSDGVRYCAAMGRQHQGNDVQHNGSMLILDAGLLKCITSRVRDAHKHDKEVRVAP